MTKNTQSLLDRMAEALRDVTEVVEMTIGFGLFDHSEPREGSPALKAQQVLAEYEAHKANHFEDMLDMVKARQCDAVPVAWQYRLRGVDRDWKTYPSDPVILDGARYETRSLYTEQPPVLSAELREALAQAIDALYVHASESNNPMFSAEKRAKAAIVREFMDSTK